MHAINFVLNMNRGEGGGGGGTKRRIKQIIMICVPLLYSKCNNYRINNLKKFHISDVMVSILTYM